MSPVIGMVGRRSEGAGLWWGTVVLFDFETWGLMACGRWVFDCFRMVLERYFSDSC